VAALVVGALPTQDARACSTFRIDAGGQLVFAKNYDWDVEEGLVVVNRRNVEKTGLTFDNPARWTSRYGSVTFNQYGRELPNGGMNEAGLVVEIMWLEETVFPEPDARPSVTTLQWIQYQLDRSATVNDVIDSDSQIRISPVGGKMVSRGVSPDAPVLTNHTYARSMAYLQERDGMACRTRGSLDRFVRAVRMVAQFDATRAPSAVDYAFTVLDSVSQGEYTKWQIVYDIAGKKVHFRTHASGERKTLDCSALDFDCSRPAKILDVNTHAGGDVTKKLREYDTAANLALVETTFHKTDFLAASPEQFIRMVAGFPETTRCRPEAGMH
jgi:penicillin V acylase-like amidase (Ntn superfamily)